MLFHVESAVKSAVEEEDRTKNLMMFGVVEEKEEELEKKILEVLEQVDEKPRVAECSRIGNTKKGEVRPIKVTIYSADAVHRILSKAGRLKKTEAYQTVFLAADRTVKERAARKRLVEQLKQKQQTEPDQYHFVRNDKICSRSKASAK